MNIDIFELDESGSGIERQRNLLEVITIHCWSFFALQVVVNALIQAIPSICNVLLVCLVFWLIFGIMGVQLFGGRYHKCVDPDGNLVNSTLVQNKSVCDTFSDQNYTWTNSKINFDNVLSAYLALFQVVGYLSYIILLQSIFLL